jgi:hypothetical protein
MTALNAKRKSGRENTARRADVEKNGRDGIKSSSLWRNPTLAAGGMQSALRFFLSVPVEFRPITKIRDRRHAGER